MAATSSLSLVVRLRDGHPASDLDAEALQLAADGAVHPSAVMSVPDADATTVTPYLQKSSSAGTRTVAGGIPTIHTLRKMLALMQEPRRVSGAAQHAAPTHQSAEAAYTPHAAPDAPLAAGAGGYSHPVQPHEPGVPPQSYTMGSSFVGNADPEVAEYIRKELMDLENVQGKDTMWDTDIALETDAHTMNTRSNKMADLKAQVKAVDGQSVLSRGLQSAFGNQPGKRGKGAGKRSSRNCRGGRCHLPPDSASKFTHSVDDEQVIASQEASVKEYFQKLHEKDVQFRR